MNKILLVAILFFVSPAARAVDCGHPNAQTFSDAADYARLASEVYKPNGGAGAGDFKPHPELHSSHDTGLTGSGLNWAVYENEKTGEVVLAFRGSELPWESPMDWVNNVANAIGALNGDQFSPQYDEARKVATALKAKYGNKLTITGHSLGGGLASYAANHVGVKGHTFNPAPISNTRINGSAESPWTNASDRGIVNHIHETDPLYQLYNQNISLDGFLEDAFQSITGLPDWLTPDFPDTNLEDLASRLGSDMMLTEGDYATGIKEALSKKSYLDQLKALYNAHKVENIADLYEAYACQCNNNCREEASSDSATGSVGGADGGAPAGGLPPSISGGRGDSSDAVILPPFR